MSKEILLTIQEFRDDDERSKFLIVASKEIQLTLQAIIKHRSFIVIYYGDEQFLKTIPLFVNEQGLWLDIGPNEQDNQKLLNSENITLVSVHHGAKIQFVSHQAVLAIFAGNPAFYIPLPEEILRLQRRDNFRLNISGEAALKCEISVGEKQDDYREFNIVDISLGGIALVCDNQKISFLEGQLFTDCKINLPDIGTLLVTLHIKNIFNKQTPSGQIKHAGCEFKQLDPSMTKMLQRYIDTMQSKMSGHR